MKKAKRSNYSPYLHSPPRDQEAPTWVLVVYCVMVLAWVVQMVVLVFR